MNITPLISALPTAPFRSLPHTLISSLSIFLYRAPHHPPLDVFFEYHHGPDSRFRFLNSFQSPGPLFELFADLSSLRQPLPLCFFLDAIAMCDRDPGLCDFRFFSGPAAPDADTFRALITALSSFPDGWLRTPPEDDSENTTEHLP